VDEDSRVSSSATDELLAGVASMAGVLALKSRVGCEGLAAPDTSSSDRDIRASSSATNASSAAEVLVGVDVTLTAFFNACAREPKCKVSIALHKKV